MEVNVDEMVQARAGIERIDAIARRANADRHFSRRNQARYGVASRRLRVRWTVTWDTAEAIAVIFDTFRKANSALDASRSSDTAEAAFLVATVIDLARALGIKVGGPRGSGRASGSASDDEIEALVAAQVLQHEKPKTSPKPTEFARNSPRWASWWKTPPAAPVGTGRSSPKAPPRLTAAGWLASVHSLGEFRM